MGGLGAGLRSIHWDLKKLPPFEKNFYIEHPDVTKREETEAARWRSKHGITVQGHGIPKPVFTFEEASMPEYVLQEVMKQGFDAPTPIQSQGWPMALLGRDMIGISATGSGKTLAFLLPAMIHINAQVQIFSFSMFNFEEYSNISSSRASSKTRNRKSISSGDCGSGRSITWSGRMMRRKVLVLRVCGGRGTRLCV